MSVSIESMQLIGKQTVFFLYIVYVLSYILYVGLCTESKGWELCAEAESHATEWYEFKNEDLHFQGLTDDIEEQNKHI